MMMRLRNSSTHYGLIAQLLHWSIALITLSLFALGLWMVELDYYDAWYQRAPWWHKGFGIFVFGLVLFRLGWKLVSPSPASLDSHKTWEKISAKAAHHTMNLLLLLIGISGYLIVTAKGDPVEVFNWFSIPAVITGIPKLEDLAGDIHFYLACALIAIVIIHALAAIKHHVIDRDATLRRMTGRQ